MKNFSIKQKTIAALLGSYAGNLIASGLGELVGVDWNGGVWWDWIVASLVVGTTISFPIALLFFYTIVPFVFKRFGYSHPLNTKECFFVGSASGAIPIVLGFGANFVYAITCCGLSGYMGVIPAFLYMLFHAVCVGTACLLILYNLSYNKPLNLTGANNAPPN
jgi:hypothetical protein